MSSRRLAIAALVGMAGTFGFAEWARPTIKDSDSRPNFSLEELFPKTFGDWKVDPNVPVVVPPPDQQELLDKIYNQTLARTYVNTQGERVMLSVAYGGDQSDGLSVHMPEVCYVSQGFKLEWTRPTVLTVGGIEVPARQLLTTLGGRVEPITYWILVGDQAIVSQTERRIVSLRYGLRRRIPDGILVRVSSIDPRVNTQPALDLHLRFITDMTAAIPPREREWVVGAGRV